MITNSINLPNIIYSKNCISDLINITKKKKCILFTSNSWTTKKIYKEIINYIKPVKVFDNIQPNPQLHSIFELNIDFKKIDICISLGGGSVIDFTKGILGYNLINNKKIFSKLLIANKQCFKKNKSLPKIVAIPTTSGTGSEINSWGTIWNNNNKLSVSGEQLKPSYIILDSNLCCTMPESVTISSALDALSHCFESVWNKNYSYLTDEISKIAIRKIIKFLPLVITDHKNTSYRRELQLAALLAGLSMSQTKTAICHSMSYPLTSYFKIPHGLACALTMADIADLHKKSYSKRLQVIYEAFGAKPTNIKSKIDKFFLKINYIPLLKPYKNIKITKNINFINTARSKNSFIKITNSQAFEIINKALKRYTE